MCSEHEFLLPKITCILLILEEQDVLSCPEGIRRKWQLWSFLYDMSYYSSGLVLWILIFFFPSLSILFPMDLILLPFMLMLSQWSSLISKEFLHIYNLFHPEAVGIRREATHWRRQMLNVSNPFSNEIKSVERHEWGQKASFPVLCVWRKETAVRRKCERNGLYICVPLYWGLTGNTWGLIQEKVNSIPL